MFRRDPIAFWDIVMNIALISLGVVGVGSSVYWVFDFYEQLDGVLQDLHESHPDVWVTIGRPTGRAWVPKGGSGFKLPGPMNWLKWEAGREPEWHASLEPDLKSRISRLHRAMNRQWAAFGAFLGGAATLLLGLAVG